MGLSFQIPLKPELSEDQKHNFIYMCYFIDSKIKRLDVSSDQRHLEVYTETSEPKELEDFKSQASELLKKYDNVPKFKEVIYESWSSFNRPISAEVSTYKVLKEKSWLKESSKGLVNLGTELTCLKNVFDDIILGFAAKVKADLHSYPSMLPIEFMKKSGYFKSFPHHVLFLNHLEENFGNIENFSNAISEADEGEIDYEAINESCCSFGRMLSPAVCYHTYKHFENSVVDSPDRDGVTASALNSCYRHESKNVQSLSRLYQFSMREIVFIGKPKWVMDQRDLLIEFTSKLMTELDLSGELVNANDPFFTSTYEVKASMQRAQEMKLELKLDIPCENSKIAAASFNFHSSTFGKAYDIKLLNGRPACSSCVGFGYERWLFAFLSQKGLNPKNWPLKIASAFEEKLKNQQLLN